MINIKLKRRNPFAGLIEPCEEGENIITKIRRIVDENEPIEDGAPLIYTEKKDGVRPEFDIRTDKWSIAMNAMDKFSAYEASKYLKEGTIADVEGKGEKPSEPENPNPVMDN
ncbi:hypothetical protein [Sigmofec virus UA08Rod_4510]|uniref:Uncharacterized protein n=1 Tax=Sigmofec virus UA08Rod_4510 TaxID=2929402 RepID=A0A976N1R0_9VIRU|nr:hypothetical protein [Sigmofec virus UA08Rod_4510]